MIMHKPRGNWRNSVIPDAIPGIARVGSMKILGVTISDDLSFDSHVDKIVVRAAQTGYALRVLKTHGLLGIPLWQVARTTLVAQMVYASPVWWGSISMGNQKRIQAVFKRMMRQGMLEKDSVDFVQICERADAVLFAGIMRNCNHVLHHLLPPVKETKHCLRNRVHNRIIPKADNHMRKKFIYRMIYKNIY